MQTTSYQPSINGKALLKKKRPQAAFNAALKVMIDLRSQPGIVDPSQSKMFYTVDYKKGKGVGVGQHFYSTGQVLGPAYASIADVDSAILSVGSDRIEKAFETLLFIGQ